jgi:hypothetical protein
MAPSGSEGEPITTKIPHAIQNLTRVGDIIFERPPIEGLYRDEYEALVADLEAHGWKVEEVASFEQRGVPQEALHIAFRVLNDLGEDGLKVMVRSLIAHLRKPRQPGTPARQAVIYGPKLEVLAKVDLDD